MGDENQRAGQQHRGDEFGEHGLTGLVDPVHILDDVQRRCRTCEGGGLQQDSQSALAGIGEIVGRTTSGSPIPIRSFSNSRSSGFAFGISKRNGARAASGARSTYREHRSQQQGEHSIRRLARMRLTERGVHLDAPGIGQLGRIADSPALANAGRSNQRGRTPTLLIDGYSISTMVFISAARSTRAGPRRASCMCSLPTASRRRAGAALLEPLMRTCTAHPTLPHAHQSRGRLTEHHPAGGATDSIRCANPTCSPIAV